MQRVTKAESYDEVLDSMGQAPSRVTARLVLGLALSLAAVAGLVGALTWEQ